MKFTGTTFLLATLSASFAHEKDPAADRGRHLRKGDGQRELYHSCTPDVCCAWSPEAKYCGEGIPVGYPNSCGCPWGGYPLPGCQPLTPQGCCYDPHSGECASSCYASIDEQRCESTNHDACFCPPQGQPGHDECKYYCETRVGCCYWDPVGRYCTGGTAGYTQDSCYVAGGTFNPGYDYTYPKKGCDPEPTPGFCYDEKDCYYGYDDNYGYSMWYCDEYATPKGACSCSISEYNCQSCDGAWVHYY